MEDVFVFQFFFEDDKRWVLEEGFDDNLIVLQ